MAALAPTLELHGITLRRGGMELCDALGAKLGGGQLLELVGPNGSGKSTLLRVLAGLLLPDAGEVRWQGRPVADDLYAYNEQMAYVGHRDGVAAPLSAAANIAIARRLSAGAGSVRAALARLGIAALADRLGGVLSAGQSRRVALARLLVRRARLWLLDEPLSNLDDEGCRLVRAVVAEHLDGGGLVVAAGPQAGAWGPDAITVRLA